MSERIYSYVLIIAFSASLCLPLLLLEEKAVSTSENRVLAPAPEWPRSWSEAARFFRAWESYFNEQYGLRSAGIGLEAGVARVLNVDTSPLVTQGEAGWLYYAGTRNERPLVDYSGLNRFTSAELELWAERLSERSDWLRKRGIRYLFLIVPNKAEIYPEYLPKRYARRWNEPRAWQLVEYLREHTSVEAIYLRDELLGGKASVDEFGPYGKWGTHWNGFGAALGYNALRRWWLGGAAAESLYDPSDFQLGSVGVDTDLARLALQDVSDVGLGPKLKDDLPAGERRPLELAFNSNGFSGDSWRLSFPNEKKARALVFGDSFFVNLADYFQADFGAVYFLSARPSTGIVKAAAVALPVDVVVEQRVERFLWDLPQE